MSNFVFDFCSTSRVAEEIPPEEVRAASMNGWDYSAKPKVPYRATFKVTLYGMKWYLNSAGDALDVATDPTHNMGRLRSFYKDHRTWDSFLYNHEFLGQIRVRFEKPITFPAAKADSGGMLEPIEVTLIHHNPSF